MPNKLYLNEETLVTFSSSGDVTLTLTSLSSGAGRLSDQQTLTAPFSPNYRWSFKTNMSGSTTVGSVIRLYVIGESNGVRPNAFGVADAGFASLNQLNGVYPFGIVPVWTTAGNTAGNIQMTGQVYIPYSKFSLAVWNAASVSMSSTASQHELTLTPLPNELQ